MSFLLYNLHSQRRLSKHFVSHWAWLQKFMAAFCPSVAKTFFCVESHELCSVPGNWERLSNNYASSGSNTNFTGKQSGERKKLKCVRHWEGLRGETKAQEERVWNGGKRGRTRKRERVWETEGRHTPIFSLIFESWDQRRWNTLQNSIKIHPASLKLSIIIQELPHSARPSVCSLLHTHRTGTCTNRHPSQQRKVLLRVT